MRTAGLFHAVRRTLEDARLLKPSEPSRARAVRSFETTLDKISTTGAASGDEINLSGMVLGLNPSSHASVVVEVCFDTNEAARERWLVLTPGQQVEKADGRPFERFFVRRLAATPATATSFARFDADPSTYGGSIGYSPRTPNVNDAGALDAQLKAKNLAGALVDVIASDEGALAASGWTGAAYARLLALGAALADALANPGAGLLLTGAHMLGWNGATWDRLRTAAGAAGTGVLRTVEATLATGASTTVATASGASTQVVGANAARRRCTLRNNTTTAGATLYYAVGAAAVVGTGPVINPGESWDVFAVGAINVIRGTATDVSVGACDESV